MWELVCAVVGVLLVAAMWDVARRAVLQFEAHRALRERVDELQRRIEKEHEVMQHVLAKLNATTAAAAARMPMRSVSRG